MLPGIFSMQLLNRRRFLRLAGSGLAVSALFKNCPAVTQAEAASCKPLFSFVQWNDTHVDANKGYPKANEKMAYLVDWVNAKERSSYYDFVVGIGDMIQGSNYESLKPDSQVLKKLLAGLKIPFYPVVGNHENVQKEGDPEFEAPFCEAFEIDKTNYTVRHKGFLFVMLNNRGSSRLSKSPVGKRRNAWLRRVLEGSADTPKIICCHIPLVLIRDEEVLKKSFGFISYTAGDMELLGLIDEHADSIVAVLSGHLHITGTVRRKGVHHIVISGTASYPCDFATYDVFPDHVRVKVRRLPEELLTPESNIHGKRRHNIDYTDSDHPTHESYIMGNASERDFEMKL
jgi:hypothetical protein